jgi:hypothetical protein
LRNFSFDVGSGKIFREIPDSLSKRDIGISDGLGGEHPVDNRRIA